MALNQNAHRRNMRAMQTIEELRRNQKKYNQYPKYSTLNEINNNVHDIGDGLSKVNNEKVSNIGRAIADNTGSNLKRNVFNFAKDKISSLTNKGHVVNASIGNAVSNAVNNADKTLNVINQSSNITNAANGLSNAANATNNIAKVADTASDVAKVADTANKASQASNALSKVGNSNPVLSTVSGALNVGNDLSKGDYVNAGMNAAATAANFIPVYGQAIAAAIKVAQMVKSKFDKKKQESIQKSQKAAEKSAQASLEGMNETKQKIAEKQAQQKQAFADNPINGQLGDGTQVPMAKPSFEEMAQTVQPTQPVPETIEPPMQEQPVPETPVETVEPTQEENPLGTIADVVSDVVPQGEEQSISDAGQKQNVLKNLMSKVFSKDEGQFTGGAAPLFEYPYREGEVASKVFKRTPEFGQEVFKYTPEQLKRHNEAILGQNQAFDTIGKQVKNNATKPTGQTSIRQVTPAEQGLTDNTIPAVPNVVPTAMPTQTTNGTLAGQQPQFEIIEPQTGTTPTGETQVATTPIGEAQPATMQQPTVVQQQADPSVMYKTPEGLKQRIANNLARAQQGYNENSTNGFKLDNVTANEYQAPVQDKNGVISNEAIKKDIWNRIGEFAGTGKRVLSNPLAQGAIAGLLYKATGGDNGESLRFGVDWANDKAKSDFYQKQIDPNASPNVFGGRYTSDDWKNKSNIEIAKAQQATAQAKLEQTEAYNQVRIQKMLHDMQSKPLTQDNSFNVTFKGIFGNKNMSATRKIEALTNLLRDYSLVNVDEAKKLADAWGIDLSLEV